MCRARVDPDWRQAICGAWRAPCGDMVSRRCLPHDPASRLRAGDQWPQRQSRWSLRLHRISRRPLLPRRGAVAGSVGSAGRRRCRQAPQMVHRLSRVAGDKSAGKRRKDDEKQPRHPLRRAVRHHRRFPRRPAAPCSGSAARA